MLPCPKVVLIFFDVYLVDRVVARTALFELQDIWLLISALLAIVIVHSIGSNLVVAYET